MEARSTNIFGFVHFGGDVVAGVNDGIAVHLRSASTGAAAIIEPLSDSSTAALTIRAKGAAVLTVGNSSNTLSLISPVLTTPSLGAASTTVFALVQKYTVQFTPPQLAASTAVNSSYAVTGLTTNSVLVFTPRMPLELGYVVQPRCSTADELILQWTNAQGTTNSGSTNRGTLLAFNF